MRDISIIIFHAIYIGVGIAALRDAASRFGWGFALMTFGVYLCTFMQITGGIR